MDLGLENKVALITGAGSQIGFGKAVALTLAQEGCDVVINDINAEDAQKTASSVEALGRNSLAIKADVTKKIEVQEMVKQTLEKFGRIDILVNNAGAISSKAVPFLEQDESIWNKDIDLNLKGTMFCSQAVIPNMLERKYGKIVNISSGTISRIHPMVSSYSIAKAGVAVFTKQMAKMLITSGITVNAVAPGWSLTNFIKGNKEAIKERFLKETPIGRGTEPQDIANTVAFLVSEVSSNIVGQVIFVDGGSTI